MQYYEELYFLFCFSAVLHSYANSNVEMLIKTEKKNSLTFRTNINSLNESRRISEFYLIMVFLYTFYFK